MGGAAVRAGALVLALRVLFAVPAWGHTRSVSYSKWAMDTTGATVTLSLAQIELTRLPWGPLRGTLPGPGLAAYLTAHLTLRAGGEPCLVRGSPRALHSPADRAVIEWRVECSGRGQREISSLLFAEVAPSHLHFAQVSGPGFGRLERVLTSAEPTWALEPSKEGARRKSQGSSIASYVMLGVEHIGTGPDHLAFVLALILIATRLGELARVITGFTVAHSITLAVGALGLAKPESGVVGAIVGLSIALVAAENTFLLAGRPRVIPGALTGALGTLAVVSALGLGGIGASTLAGLALFTLCYFELLSRAGHPERLRVAIAFAFGLVHGFGFAGFLVEMDLPRARLVPALFGFNLGVELGQLILVLALWPPLRDLASLCEGRPHRLLVEVGSAALCGLGLFWFISRSFA